ncbi:hypothetical protein SLEP1_g55513, partial [Rubroshorea leprosula]
GYPSPHQNLAEVSVVLADAIKPLVSMLQPDSPGSHHESALLALLSLAVKDEKYAF